MDLSTYDHFSHISYLMIEVNSDCNLTCRFCNRKELLKRNQRNLRRMTVDQFKYILNQFQDCPLEIVKIQGLSEPMLHPRFDRFCQIFKQQFPNAFSIVFTNGQYDFSKVPFLKSLPYIDMLCISLDGVGDLYEEIKKGAKWKQLLNTFNDIAKFVEKDIRQSKIHLNVTVNNDNCHILPQIYKLKQKFCFSSVRINLVQNWDGDRIGDYNFSTNLIKTLKKYRQDLKGVGGWDYHDCFWPFEGVVIDVFGNVRQCVVNTTSESLGNIFEQNIRNIFNNNSTLINARMNLIQNNFIPHCRFCTYKQLSPVLDEIFKDTTAKNQARTYKIKSAC